VSASSKLIPVKRLLYNNLRGRVQTFVTLRMGDQGNGLAANAWNAVG